MEMVDFVKRTTIADIAKKLQVSMHTVNKALYGKKGVGEELRAKILHTAKKMNYRANRVAQSMARNPMIIGVISHATAWPMITRPFMTGIQTAIEQLSDYNTHGKYYCHTSQKNRVAAFEQAARDSVSIVICIHFVPTEEEAACLTESGIPFAILGTDGMKDRRLTSVRANGLIAGRLVAQLFDLALPPKAQVVAFTGLKNYPDHADKIAGFTQEMLARGRQVTNVYEHGDTYDKAARLTDEALAEYPDLAGIYIATGNGVPICTRVLAHKQHPLIIATDLYDEMKAYLQQGVVAATIFQNAVGQGRRLVELLYANLCENQPVESEVFIPPSVVLPANVNAF
jgi:LacI family transcriptional regulator